MMKKMLALVFALGFLLGISSITMAYGVFEETDLMTTPTATTLHQGVLGIAANFAEGNSIFLNCDLGLAPDLEAGIAVFNYPNETYVSFRGKYQILREDGDTPALAVGVQDLGRGGNISPYITLSKSFPNVGIRGYIGVGGGNFDGIFGGLSKEFVTSRKNGNHLKGTELFIEADSHNLNVGAKFALSNQTKINFGLVDMKTWMVGATFTVK
jgi:hypothetical protein